MSLLSIFAGKKYQKNNLQQSQQIEASNENYQKFWNSDKGEFSMEADLFVLQFFFYEAKN